MCSTEKWDPENMILTDPVYSRDKLPVYSNVALPADFQKHCPVAVRCTAEPSIATERWVGMVPPDLVELAHVKQAPIQERVPSLRWVGPKMPELQALMRERVKTPKVNIQPIQDAWDAMQFFGEFK